jgi:hypothetical protein
MKLGLIMLVCAVIAVFYAKPFQATVTVTHQSSPVPAMDVSFAIVPTGHIESHPQPKAKATAVATAKHPKQWVCGDMYTNSIGGRNRDCKWL